MNVFDGSEINERCTMHEILVIMLHARHVNEVLKLKVDIHDNFRRLCKWSWISLCTALYWTSDSQLIKPASKFSIFFVALLPTFLPPFQLKAPISCQLKATNLTLRSTLKRLQHRTSCYHCVISPMPSGAMSQSIIVANNDHDGNL